MSLEINWDLLSSDTELNNRIKDFLDEQLQKITLPEFIKDIKVTEFNIGKIPPAVTIRHIGDPFDEFYESDEDEEDDDNVSEQQAEIKNSKESLPSIKLKQKSTKSTSKDLQLIAEVSYKGDLYIEISTNLLLNYPSTSFIELPIKLKLTDLIIHSLAILSYAKNLVNFSFLCDISDDHLDNFIHNRTQSSVNVNTNTSAFTNNNNTNNYSQASNSTAVHSTPTSPVYQPQTFRHNSNPVIPTFSSGSSTSRYPSKDRIDIIKDLKIDSEIGGGTYGNQSSGSVLKNVGKVEKFLVEKLRSLLRDELAWPGWISFDFSGDSDESESDRGE